MGLRLGTGSGGMRLVELFLGSGTDFIEFRVQSPDLRVQLNKTEAWSTDQTVGLHAGIVPLASGLQINAGGWLLSLRIALQIQEVEARCFHNAPIMAHSLRKRRN